MFPWSATRTVGERLDRIGRAVLETLEDRRLLSLAAPVAQAPTGSTLLWSDVDGESAYQIEYQLQGQENYHVLLDSQSGLPLNLAPDSTSAAIPPPPADHAYTFRVRALAAGESVYSNEVSLATPAAQQGGPLSGLSYGVEGTRRLLRFANSSSVDLYAAIELRNGMSAYPEAWQQGIEVAIATSTTELDITDWVAGFCYAQTDLRIKILSSGENFGKVTNTTVIAAPPREVSAPANLTQHFNDQGLLVLTWENTDDDPPEWYQIFEADTGAPVLPGAYVNSSGPLSYTFRPYELWDYPSGSFVVRANDNQRSISNFSNTSTPVETVPAAPGNLLAIAMWPNKVVVSWDNLPSNEDSFLVERLTEGTEPWEQVGSIGADQTQFVDTVDVTVGYSYRAVSHRGALRSAPSNLAAPRKAYNAQTLAGIIYGESGSLRPKLKVGVDPNGPITEQDWDPASIQDLANGRRAMGHVAINRRRSGRDDVNGVDTGISLPKVPTAQELQNPNTRREWDLCLTAARAAIDSQNAGNDLTGGAEHFYVRTGPFTWEPDPDSPYWWQRKRPDPSFGPFRNLLQQGAETFIDIYRGIP